MPGLALAIIIAFASFADALTLSTIRSGVGRLVNETDESNTHCSASDRNYWINEWQLDTAIALTSTRKSSAVVTMTDVATYTLPTDFIYALEVFYDQNAAGGKIKLGELDQSELESLRGQEWKQDASSDPIHYYFVRDATATVPAPYVIALYPPPNAANVTLSSAPNSQRLEIFYVYAPADLSADTDSPDLPAAYHYQAQYYAAAQCALKIGDMGLYDRLIAFYDRQRNFYKSRIDKRSTKEREK